MLKVPLPIHGGGSLEIHGSTDSRRWIVMMSRHSALKDDWLVTRVVDFFVQRGFTIARYEAYSTETTRLMDRKCFQRMPAPLVPLAKALLLLGLPLRWRHFSPRYRAKVSAMSYRARSLRELLGHLAPGREIFLVTRSISGRIASLAVDETCALRVACLGYPFRHPDEGANPERYAHLASLRTPFLIIQGIRDTYGGREIEGKYRLSNSITLEWAETDHEFRLPDQEWNAILERILEFFLAGSGRPHREDK